MFEEGFKLVNQVEREEWVKAVRTPRAGAERPAGAVCANDQQRPCGGVQAAARDRDR